MKQLIALLAIGCVLALGPPVKADDSSNDLLQEATATSAAVTTLTTNIGQRQEVSLCGSEAAQMVRHNATTTNDGGITSKQNAPSQSTALDTATAVDGEEVSATRANSSVAGIAITA